jgi:hypothetical protein
MDLLRHRPARLRRRRDHSLQRHPDGPPLTAAKRITGALRTPNVTGATFLNGRLYLAYDRGSYVQILSHPVDPATGDIAPTWRLEIQRTKTSQRDETEGLAQPTPSAASCTGSSNRSSRSSAGSSLSRPRVTRATDTAALSVAAERRLLAPARGIPHRPTLPSRRVFGDRAITSSHARRQAASRGATAIRAGESR